MNTKKIDNFEIIIKIKDRFYIVRLPINTDFEKFTKYIWAKKNRYYLK